MTERNADVSKTLTEKWHKGELPSGWYWVKGVRAEGIYAYTSEYLNNIDRPADGEKIVEKVPSYEEYQKLLSDQLAKNEGVEINAELEAENTKLKTENKWYFEQLHEAVKQYDNLKELLKKCKEILYIEEMVAGNPRYIDELRILIKRINQLLGEENGN